VWYLAFETQIVELDLNHINLCEVCKLDVENWTQNPVADSYRHPPEDLTYVKTGLTYEF